MKLLRLRKVNSTLIVNIPTCAKTHMEQERVTLRGMARGTGSQDLEILKSSDLRIFKSQLS
jgi:hypothetical protein